MLSSIKSWCFEEAAKVLKKAGGKAPQKGFVLFETGYGPSGLPHIGTFGEVVRTCFVMFAFRQLAPSIPVKLICVSDDYDGMRKIPDNVPNKESLIPHLKKPLTAVPDPFATAQSYGHNMNARLRAFLDSFGFEYEFLSATECYKNGKFNTAMLKVVEKYDELMDLMMKNLGEERQETYSPIMPISPISGKVLETGVKGVNKANGTVIFVDEDGAEKEISVCNGNCKLQWKIDFGARWMSLEVDYEIFGKDHMPNEKLYQQICKILGGVPPVNYWYELFLGEDGAKISKSKGNGVSVGQWLQYAPKESMSLFMYQKPKTAKRLFFDVIPRYVDEYIQYTESYHKQSEAEKLENPSYYINFGSVPVLNLGAVNYSLLLNLASACNPENDAILWGFIEKYNPQLQKGSVKFLDDMVQKSLNYYNNFIKPHKKFRPATPQEATAINNLLAELTKMGDEASGDEMQNVVYKIGKEAEFDIKNWFVAIYQILLGQDSGPRVGSFIKIFGLKNFAQLCKSKV